MEVRTTVLLLGCALSLAAQAPLYTPSSIVNAASYKVGPLAPNTIATLYGKNLAFNTKAVSQEDIYAGILPTTLLGTGVRLVMDGSLLYLYYVSPTQINFLVPSNFTPGRSKLQLNLDGKQGELVTIELKQFSPALFQVNPEMALATRLDGTLINADAPARPGEFITLYATGLGETKPRIAAGQIPRGIAWLENFANFSILLNGQALDRGKVLYAGAAPGFAGLYQINAKLPDSLPSNPEIRIGFNDILSPADLRLPTQAGNPE